jgi:HAD superfamily hydrolase (TIGR01509 family)
MPTLLRSPRAVLFDVGDTLLAETRFDLEAGIASVASAYAQVADLAEAFRAEVAACHRHRSEPLLAAWLHASVRELAGQSIESLEDALWPAIVTLEPQPGIASVLSALSGDGILMGAVSNAAFSGRILESELRRHGLADHFRFVLTSADARSRKPAPDLFHRALGHLGVAARDAWFVGDTLDEDIVGARDAGLQPVWFAPQAPDTRGSELPTVRTWQEFASLYASVRTPAG